MNSKHLNDSPERPERLDVLANGPDQEPTPDEIAEHLWLEERHERRLREYEAFMSGKLGSDWKELGLADEAFRSADDQFWDR